MQHMPKNSSVPQTFSASWQQGLLTNLLHVLQFPDSSQGQRNALTNSQISNRSLTKQGPIWSADLLVCWSADLLEAAGLLGYWAAGDCWATGLLVTAGLLVGCKLLCCWADGLLGWWSAGPLVCWSAGLLVCWLLLVCWATGVLVAAGLLVD